MSEKMIPLSVPCIQGNEWKYIKECLDTEWVSSAGGYVDRFEEKISEYTGVPFAIAVVNGTAALHIALLVAGVLPDDEVIVPTLTFIAPINAVRYICAHPVFMDCDEYYNIDASKTVKFLKENAIFSNGNAFNKTTNRRISAIIPVHVFGNAARIEEFQDICEEYNIRIIEDASESLGTYYTKGRFEGNYTGTVGDIGCFSFNGNKIITTGGGGMIVTRNDKYARRSRYISTQAKDDPVRYIHNETGYNYRITNIQAAMGVAQLENLDGFIGRKTVNYGIYREGISSIDGLRLADVPDYASQNHWFYSLQIDKDIYGMGRDGLMDHLLANNVQTRPVWYLNHLQKMYKGCQAYMIDRAVELWEQTLNLPCSSNLRKEDVMKVLEVL